MAGAQAPGGLARLRAIIRRFAPAREFFYRVANPRHLLEIALQAELNAFDFFQHVGLTSDNVQVCALARQMAAEEKEHVVWVRNALEYHPANALAQED